MNTMDMSNREIFPNWKIKRLIGSGSYGKVYELERVEQETVYRSALKVVNIPQNEGDVKTRLAEGESPETIGTYYRDVARNLLNENRVMAELKGNSNIVSYEDHQVVEHEDGIGCDIYIRMELLTPFIEYMSKNRITESTVIRLGKDMCRALEICESRKIIHRDIKPENIFVSGTNDFKLGDFGIARTIDKTTGGLSKKGTYRYMAPEVYKGDAYGKTVDIYSLGLVMYYLTNGNRTPFLPSAPQPISFGDEEGALVRRMKGEPIPPPRFAGPELAAVIMKACAYDPADRYQTPGQMRMDLERIGTGQASTEETVYIPELDATQETEYIPVAPSNQKPAYAPGTQQRTAGTAPTPPAPRSGKKVPKWLIIAAIAAGALVGIIAAMVTANDPEMPVGPQSIPAEGIDIAFTDLDWDSKRGSEAGDDYYQVDMILYVNNNSAQPITGIEYTGNYCNYRDKKNEDKISGDGEDLTDFEGHKPTAVLKADGFIPAGRGGIMIGTIDAPKGKANAQPKDDTCKIQQAITNYALESYVLPKGKVINHKESDHYDITIDNLNDFEVDKDATLVAVSLKSSMKGFEEADATGRLSQNIPANQQGYKIENAFYDPHFHAETNAEMMVYAIDRNLYRYAGTDETEDGR